MCDEETKNKKSEVLGRNGAVIKSVESVLRLEPVVGKICERGRS